MSDTVEQAATCLRRGELILLATETVYGLGADAGNPDAVAAIFEAKGRPRFNPLISHVSDAAAAEEIGVFGLQARALAEAFWPGPLTLVTPVRDAKRVCDLARAGLDSVAIRVPGHAKARAVLAAFGGPVVAPSANRSGRPSPTTFADSGEGHRSPGRLTLHYAPDAPVRIEADQARDGEVLLGFGAGVGDARWSLSPTGDLREAAANLFRLLREADRTHPAGIAVSPIPAEGLGEAINDRLRRAAGHVG